VQEAWDYVPFGGEMCGGSKVNFSDNAKTFVEPGPDRIGAKYLKALYVEYTDATFTTRKVSIPSMNSDECQPRVVDEVWTALCVEYTDATFTTRKVGAGGKGDECQPRC
jgi:hypothetical protein